VRWRLFAAVLSGLLLTVPLLVLISGQWFAQFTPPEPTRGRVVPVLSGEQRRQLPTWHQPCRRSEDCDSPLACFYDRHVRGLYCTDSSCVTDSQCDEGFVCVAVETWGGEVLKRCALEGVRKEGERCEPLSKRHARACSRGLLCNDWCGRPCAPQGSGSCPEGFFCPPEGGPNGPSCLPTCEARGCPPGQVCIRFHLGASVCAEVEGTNCQQAPCPQGQACEVRAPPERPGTVRMRCQPR
jgi:hypothetical protein